MGRKGFTQKQRKRRNAAYDGTAKSLHWTIAILVVIQYATKLVPNDIISGFTEDHLDAWHISIGPMILALMVLRLVWRLTHRVPSVPGDLPLALQLASQAVHWLFYAMLLLLPVLGWIAASAYGVKPDLIGLMPLPALVTPNEWLGGQIGQLHGILAWALLALIVVHIAGATYHALIKKDGVVSRMLQG